MKKLFAIAFCALLAAVAAEAKTYYVDASRPNNNGNGRSLKAAKKTIQAAINLAKKGDTILVYPGTYAPIRTNDKKITVKSAKGASKTKIVKPDEQQDVALAKLGKPWTKTYYIPTDGTTGTYTSPAYAKGKNSVLCGFLLDGLNRESHWNDLIGISGGIAKSCTIQRLGQYDREHSYGGGLAILNASLTNCKIRKNYGVISETSVFNRCKITDNYDDDRAHALEDSRLYNCLIAGNKYKGYEGNKYNDYLGTGSLFSSSTAVNCTITKNYTYRGDNKEAARFATQTKFHNCILRNNYRQTKKWDWDNKKQASVLVFGAKKVHNVDSDTARNVYGRTYKDNRDPKFADEKKGNCKLKKGSPCINKGTLTASQKKKLGSRDLAGKKRIRGKAVDMGCYEY